MEKRINVDAELAKQWRNGIGQVNDVEYDARNASVGLAKSLVVGVVAARNQRVIKERSALDSNGPNRSREIERNCFSVEIGYKSLENQPCL